MFSPCRELKSQGQVGTKHKPASHITSLLKAEMSSHHIFLYSNHDSIYGLFSNGVLSCVLHTHTD